MVLSITLPRFSTQINQSLIEATYDALVKQRPVTVTAALPTTVQVPPPASAGSTAGAAGAAPTTSLLELGYMHAGIDDGWQQCGGKVGFHNISGYPIVNRTRFPDMRAMTDKAKQSKWGWSRAGA